MHYPGEGKRGKVEAGDYVLAAERIRAEAHGNSGSNAATDLARADRWKAKARTKLSSPKIGAGGALLDLENKGVAVGVVNTVTDPDYVTVAASIDRLELADEAGALSLALDAADTIQARDSLEKLLVDQMSTLHRGMMKAAARMNEDLTAAAMLHDSQREAANVRSCRFMGGIARMSSAYQQGMLTLQRWRTGGNQHVTVKHIYQQVNVTEGGQAVVAADRVTNKTRGRRGAMGGGPASDQ